MLNNLMSEFVKRGISPNLAVMQAIGCSEKTARNKLNGITPFTVPEAVKVVEMHFKGRRPDIAYLFVNTPPDKAS